ncbi:SDR family oxidoreductase [Actinoallomurus liliacearum]|uniref:SDR family oxidoreductase n=1 Tax=Actinoallomurus liliacearum TaxID=1080073 RepID=A0ABP8TG39_9ACTN
MSGEDRGLCLVTGATGYIGGRLVPELLGAGYRVRCLARSPERLRARPWFGRVEVARADVLDAAAVRTALEGVAVAYYLVHALGSGPGFAERDRRAARTFGTAALEAGVGRIVYLGGLVPAGDGGLSEHLRSRAEVGAILLASGVPTAALRAGVVLGSGSASFEMMRYLTERLPVMVTPRWVRTRTQPIAVRDVLWYLVGCAALPPSVNRTFDIGGPDVLTYEEMMRRYAALAGLPRRVVVRVPILTAHLSSLWVGLVTPVPGGLARPLVESQSNEVVCRERDIRRFVPDPPGGPTGFDDAMRLALRRAHEAEATTPDSAAASPSDPSAADPAWAGGTRYTDVRESPVAAPPDVLWRVIEGIGGDAGWYSWRTAWAVRGGIDRLVGGVGSRRGRRDPRRLRVGDTVDFWRVEKLIPGVSLRLRAEMRLPGLAWLELGVEERGGRTWYRQRAVFRPHGLFGHLYWWAIRPCHEIVFGGMLRGVRRAAERAATRAPRPATYAR